MSSPVNPIISGMMAGYGIHQQMEQARLNQAASDREERRVNDEIQTRDIQTQMALADRGYKPSTPDQDAEIATGVGPGKTSVPGAIGKFDSPSVPSDIKTRLAKYGGKTYVRETDDEQLAKQLKTVKALGDVKTQEAVNTATGTLNATGITPSDATSGKLGIKPGQKVRAENLDDLVRGVRDANAADTPIGQPRITTDNAGNQTAITTSKTGKITETPIAAKGKTTTAPADRQPSAYQQAQLLRQAQKDHDAAQTATQKQIDGWQKQEQALHQQNGDIGARLIAGSKGTAVDKKGKKVTVTPDDAVALKAQLATNQTKIAELHKNQTDAIMKFAQSPTPGATPPAAAPAGAGTWDAFKKNLINLPGKPGPAAPPTNLPNPKAALLDEPPNITDLASQ